MLAWVEMLSIPSVVMILALVGVHVPPPFLLKRRLSVPFLMRRDGIDASRRNLLLGGVPVEMFDI